MVNYILRLLISELRRNAQVPTGLVNLVNVSQTNNLVVENMENLCIANLIHVMWVSGRRR